MTHSSHHHSLAHTAGTHASPHAGAVAATVDADALRAQIIDELNIGHLTEDEQNQIVEALGDVLLERATYAVMERLSEQQLAELDTLAEHASDALLQQKIAEFVPDAGEVIAAAVREGIEEHKRLVAEEVGKDEAETAS